MCQDREYIYCTSECIAHFIVHYLYCNYGFIFSTRGNMNKMPVGPSSDDSTSSSTVEVECSDSTKIGDYSSQLWNINLVDDSSSKYIGANTYFWLFSLLT